MKFGSAYFFIAVVGVCAVISHFFPNLYHFVFCCKLSPTVKMKRVTTWKEGALHATNWCDVKIPSRLIFRLQDSGNVLYSRRLSVVAECPMDLTLFPFDTQICKLAIESCKFRDFEMFFKDNNCKRNGWLSSKILTERIQALIDMQTIPIKFIVKCFKRVDLNDCVDNVFIRSIVRNIFIPLWMLSVMNLVDFKVEWGVSSLSL